MDTEDSDSSLGEVDFLDDDLMQCALNLTILMKKGPDDDMDSCTWNDIEPESDAEFMEDHGLIEEVTSISDDNTVNPIDCYRHFITDEIIDLIVRETNLYAEQYLQNHEITNRSILHQWNETTNEEMVKFFEIIIEMGLVQMPKLKYYWNSSQLYGSDIIRNAMPRKRFELLLKFWHFSNNDDENANHDRLSKLKPLLNLLRARFLSVFIPGSTVTIDETMIPWQGRLSFKQYISGKAHKYRIKMYKLAPTNGFTWNFVISTGQQDPTAGLGHVQTVVMNLLNGLQGCYRTVGADNFFTSIPLAKCLLEDDTYLIGTLRTNRAGSSSEIVRRNLSRGEVYGLQDRDGVKLIKWIDKKDVLMISTRPSYSATVVNTGTTNSKNERIMKPQVILDYNKGRLGSDLSDQLSSYYTCLRRSIKWYRKVAFQLLFGTALVNAT